MATERDDAVSRRYRELATEEPGGHLDAAILAASRRAVGAKPGGLRRWAGPLSIAAVLVLGIGISLRMQMEQPGVESSLPQEAPPRPDEKRDGVGPPSAAAPAATPAPAPVAKEREAPLPLRKAAPQPRQGLAPSPKPAPPRQPDLAPPPKPAPELQQNAAPRPQAVPEAKRADAPPAARGFAADAVAPAAPPPAAGAAAVGGAAPATLAAPQRAKREAASSGEAATALEGPEAELERIARLRADGRHDEADRALEAFRRRHPDYRIPEATWERVRPRP